MDEEKSNISNTQDTNTKGNDTVEDPSRRDFLKKGAIALGAVLFLNACNSQKGFTSEKKSGSLFDENVDELNSQFNLNRAEHLNNDHTFNYQKYTERYPDFEQYVPIVDEFSIDIQKQYGIERSVMRALSSSIICANLGNWEQIDYSKDLNVQRTGPMQFHPVNVLPTVDNIFKRNFSVEEANIPQNNIYFGMISLAESLKSIKNNGSNSDLMSLMLAHYYGGSPLVDVVKNDKRAEGKHYLAPNYELFTRTKSILNNETLEQSKANELAPEIVWERVISLWPEAKFKENWHNFEKQIAKYDGTFGLNQAELLALFVSVAMVESSGGVDKFNPTTHATGWYQLVPMWKHLEDYNRDYKTNYTYEQLLNNDDISIEVGVWTLMRYKDSKDLYQSLRMFKGGHIFGNTREDIDWWNKVSTYTQQLLEEDRLKMGYLN